MGEGFGELALLYNAPRSASIKAKEASFLWAIDRVTFRKVAEEMVAKDYEDNRNFIEDIAFFREQIELIYKIIIIFRKSYSRSKKRFGFCFIHPEILQRPSYCQRGGSWIIILYHQGGDYLYFKIIYDLMSKILLKIQGQRFRDER